MGIVGGTDNRRVIQPGEQDFTRFPLPAVTAVDTITDIPNNDGILAITGLLLTRQILHLNLTM
ncbi:hypothetical protein IQ238_28855 [Pleurocapsales cyanobacterium LEGE 06147]|nr:hypothetical protein [Pleurocapsales cyanobacterium LEGE 06147]